MRRPRLLTTDDWPESELRAAVLAGELVAVGECWAATVEPQDPALRAAATAWALPDRRLVAATRTATWIWGGVSRPPLPHECVVPKHVRLRVGTEVRLREVVLDPADVVVLADLAVTRPERTALDLLRTPGPAAGRFDPQDEAAVRGLLDLGLVDVDRVTARLQALEGVPMARQALRRLSRIAAR
ncbi:hypothetical protein Csp2054_13440 [Curtobacterium sp. 'Ferrero']|uniref:hypothetical protein n=1 Tax=Curtobacterium sp. 'Ferrero' TaxID=2033654 RepID=UPI000BC95D68|nr:hypothetical protein [Curtobacterium sp. 'Ferrero']PCN47130.1 hypothetical protein Csp2054_13440 [Curtobacterium sp. 'Ferrero']